VLAAPCEADVSTPIEGGYRPTKLVRIEDSNIWANRRLRAPNALIKKNFGRESMVLALPDHQKM
jgi:hypothetical protein